MTGKYDNPADGAKVCLKNKNIGPEWRMRKSHFLR